MTRAGQGPARVPLTRRLTIAASGLGYGFLAGVACGAIAGAFLAFHGLFEPPAPARDHLLVDAVAFAAFGGAYGAMAGLVVGAIGGVGFALAAPYLVHRPTATRLAGVALAPCVFAVTWIAWRAHYGDPLSPVSPGSHEVALVFGVGSWLGGAAGALVAPSVLHGRGRARSATERDTGRPPGDMGADSSA